jgi:hypothetical protein
VHELNNYEQTLKNRLPAVAIKGSPAACDRFPASFFLVNFPYSRYDKDDTGGWNS